MNEPSGTSNPDPQLVDGVDVDAVAAATRSCLDVVDLDGGPFDTVASYLPGRRVAGVRVGSDQVTLQIRSRWGVPISQVGQQVRAAVIPLILGRRLEIVISDIADPPETQLPPPSPGGSDSEVVWTSDSASAELSSGSTTPTGAGSTTSSSPV
jgi:hypothetical protein